MTFEWLNKQGVKSSKGFVVQSVDRFATEYREGNKTLTVYREPGYDNGKYLDIIESSNFERWDDGTPISADKAKEIIKNYIDARNFQNMGVIVDGQATS